MPEMALIGYKFKDREDILSQCEPCTTDTSAITNDMITLQFCL